MTATDTIPTDADFRAFAERNFERYNDLWFGDADHEPTAEDQANAGIVHVDHPDCLIVNPYVDESGRLAVDPAQHYGAQHFAEWQAQAAAAMNKGL